MFFEVEKNQRKPYQKLVNLDLSELKPDLISINIKIGFEIITIAIVFQNLVLKFLVKDVYWSEVWIQEKQAGAELCQAQLSLKLASHKVGSS